MFELFKIRWKLFKKSAVWVAALIFTCAFLGIMYSMAPSKVCDCLLLSSLFMYFICTFISLRLQDRENDVFEETLLLHSRSDTGYYLSRELQLCGISGILALVLTIAPVLKSLLYPDFFTRSINADDIIFGGILIYLCGICGMAGADIFHPRIIRQRKFGIMAVILISVLALCKVALVQSFPFLGVLNILLPPVMDAFVETGNTDRFEAMGTLLICAHLLLFALTIAVIKILLLRKMKYRY